MSLNLPTPKHGRSSDFDPSLWTPLTADLKLLSVSWESDYKNAVNWKSVEQRDEWFRKEHPGEIVIESGWNFRKAFEWSPGLQAFVGEVVVNQPVDAVRQYNYLFLDDYEKPVHGSEDRVNKFFYFISAVNSASASSTILYLEADAWTMFFNEADIVGLNVVRGHWPHKQISAEQFLEAPLESPVPLTEDEPDLPRSQPYVSYSNLISTTNSEARVCVATTAYMQELGNIWSPNGIANWDIPFEEPYFWGDDAFDGFSEKLGTGRRVSPGGTGSGGTGGRITPSPSLPSVNRVGSGSSQIRSDVRVYSTDLKTFEKFVVAVRERAPQLLEMIQAVYVLPSELIDEGEPFRLGQTIREPGYDLIFKQVQVQSSPTKLAELGITNDLFGYDERTAEFAKAYTGQFASVKISDAQGNAASIAVEELAGDMEFYARASSAFPFLKMQAFINGVGGNAEKTYAVRPLKRMETTAFQSKWKDFLFELDIPTYSIFSSSKELAGAYGIDEWIREQENSHRSAVRSADQVFEEYTAELNRIDLEERKKNYEWINVLPVDQEGELVNRNNSILSLYTSSYVRDIKNMSNSEKIGMTHSRNMEISEITKEKSDEVSASQRDRSMYSIGRSQFIQERLDASESKSIAAIRDAEVERRNSSYIREHDEREYAAQNESFNLHLNNRITRNQRIWTERSGVRNATHQWRMNNLNRRHSLDIAEMNGLTANAVQLANLYSARVENAIGVQSSSLSVTTKTAESGVNISVAAGAAMVATGPFAAAAGIAAAIGVVSAGVGFASGMADAELDFEARQHQLSKVSIDHRLNHGWRRYNLLRFNQAGWDYNIPAGYSLHEQVARAQHSQDGILNDATRDRTRAAIDENTSMLRYSERLSGINPDTGTILERESSTRPTAQGLIFLNQSNMQGSHDRWLAREERISHNEHTDTLRELSVRHANTALNHDIERTLTDMDFSISRQQTSNNVSIAYTGSILERNIALVDIDTEDRLIDIEEDSAETVIDAGYEFSIKKIDALHKQDRFNLLSDHEHARRELERKTALRYNHIQQEYDDSIRSLVGKANASRHGAPDQWGETTGDGTAQVFGETGLTVSVERISKADERVVENTFRMYGYRLPGVWVEQPQLDQMSHFTYWQADDAWILAPELADTLAIRIKQMFLEGVTLWEDPERVRMIGLGENR